MKINNQYQEAEAIYSVTGLYIDPEGSAVEKSEMLLSEHRMDEGFAGAGTGTNGQRRHDSFIRGSGIPLYL